jgi:hypothetical protein
VSSSAWRADGIESAKPREGRKLFIGVPSRFFAFLRGFVPDGRGVCRGHTPLKQGEQVVVDHELLLWLVKDVAGMAI